MVSFGPEVFDLVRDALTQVQHQAVDPERRAAAVLFGLFDDNGTIRVLLTKRSSTLRSHQGEVSFPGGKRDSTDVDLRETASREAFEEVGLTKEVIDYLGGLDDMSTTSSGFLIRPFVARIPNGFDYRCDPNEVERILTPPLSLFADEDNRRVQMWERHGQKIPIYFFEYEGEIVWGATARLIVALLDRLEGRAPEFGYLPPPASVDEDIAD